jgi:hypothetical protein
MPFPFLPGLTGPLPRESVTVVHRGDEYVLDVPALTSNYRCIYGQGCRGTTPLEGEGPGRHRPADPSVAGCCRTAPGYRFATAEVDPADAADADSPLRTAPFVAQLRPEEAQHHARIAAGDWYVEERGADGYWSSRHTTEGGNCVFLNTEMPDGRTGCALFHLAGRLGVHPSETRPMICHTAPAAAFVVDDALPDGGQRVLVTLRPPWFGWFAADGYFCTADPAAFSAAAPAFRTMSSQYAMLLGDEVYSALLVTLEEMWAERGERLRRGWGQPVALTAPTWAR